MRRVAVTVVGGTITAAGFALLFLPGPGLLVLLLGLSILATEFHWARQARHRVHREARALARRLQAERRSRTRATQRLAPGYSGLRETAGLGKHPFTRSADEVAE